jgi:hypothetical protein
MADTLGSLRVYECSDQIHLLLVDDSPHPRDLSCHVVGDWASLEVLRTPMWRDGTPDPYSAMVAGTMEGIRAAARHDPEFLLKLDTDALVIAPAADRLRNVFAQDQVGTTGSYTHTCAGARREWGGWRRNLVRATRTVAPSRTRVLRVRSPRNATSARRLIRTARRHGYSWGAHCQGGAYAVGPRLIEREDLLDWRPWVGTSISEDIAVGVVTFAAGLTMHSCVRPGEVFAVGWDRLPLRPEQIIARGYGVVHTVKDQPYAKESELRAFFRGRRDAGGSRELE